LEASRLSALQERILVLLADLEPRWRLTGGGALGGFHLGHRETRDLDLFWSGESRLGAWADEAERRLRGDGLRVEKLEDYPGFRRLRVMSGSLVTLVDLVADAVPCIREPVALRVHGAEILVDHPYEILVNKLNALLSRAEPRDLYDLRALLAHGADLRQACSDANTKDGGFSPLTLAWVLQSLPLRAAGDALGLSPSAVDDLREWRDELRDRLIRVGGEGLP
jgi:hypothetical protein